MVYLRNNRLHISFSIPLLRKYRGGGVALFRSTGEQHEVLLGLRVNNPGRGLWSFPGGEAESYEKLSDAALREFKEETGVQLLGRFISRTGIFKIRKWLFNWATLIIETNQNMDFSRMMYKYSGEFASLRWVSVGNLENYKLHRWVKEVVDFYLKGDQLKPYAPPPKPSASSQRQPLVNFPKKFENKKQVNSLFDIAEMILTKTDPDGTKYFMPKYRLKENLL